MSIWLGNKKLAGTSVKLSHNIGDIFTTSRTDTVLAGAVECNGATYDTEDYTGEGSIGELLEAGKLDHISLNDYATAINTKGWCNKIGWTRHMYAWTRGTDVFTKTLTNPDVAYLYGDDKIIAGTITNITDSSITVAGLGEFFRNSGRDIGGSTEFRVPTISPRHYIVKTQEPAAINNYTWYRLYADGWVEQGGEISGTNTDITVSLPITMANTNYHYSDGLIENSSGGTATEGWIKSRTPANMVVHIASQAHGLCWQVSGMSNITPESASRVMIQLYNGVTDEALATCENVESDVQSLKKSLNNKTNCVTNIPQDIKLELNNGALTLKAGSKVYVPNGAGVFDTITIASDLTIPAWTNTAQGMLSIKPSTSDIWVSLMNQQYSGSTTPTSSQYELWYDTDSNKVKTTSDTGSTWTDGYSLPIALITSNGSSWTSIDQVFNGFGYIGSTVFALPGVKGLIPNGRNADGTLKNTEITISNVLTGNVTVADSSHNILLQSSSIAFDDDIYEPNWQFVYKEPENIIVNTGNGSTLTGVLFGKCITGSNNKITAFSPKTVFHVVDYNDTEYMAHQATPSDRYIDLTFGASYTSYTAPADGWYYIEISLPSGAYFNTSVIDADERLLYRMTLHSTTEGYNQADIIPIKKGNIIYFEYNNISRANHFRFIYAQGAQ